MQTNPEVVKLDPSLKKKASDVVAASFFDYPMFVYYFPDIKKRARVLPWYLGNVLTCAIKYGEVFTTPESSGVIFILPPGHTKISIGEYVQNGFLLTPLVIGIRDYIRSQECEKFVADMHEKIMQQRLHYYLWGLAVDPGQKRRGIGTTLLKPALEKADKEQKPFYLETHDEKNVPYYQNFDFTLVYSGKIPNHEPEIWCMVREPAKMK
ncbi:MAG: hypothetical protein CVU39_01105 [Chloroflexi bacterium HGW-Chloroflexi-10]|nr:MAG: hypothetical protein CVU39_01105 [Chloroflexi bacterium HGW-Chloroflexi-10]